jgi:hypothetical protein
LDDYDDYDDLSDREPDCWKRGKYESMCPLRPTILITNCGFHMVTDL